MMCYSCGLCMLRASINATQFAANTVILALLGLLRHVVSRGQNPEVAQERLVLVNPLDTGLRRCDINTPLRVVRSEIACYGVVYYPSQSVFQESDRLLASSFYCQDIQHYFFE